MTSLTEEYVADHVDVLCMTFHRSVRGRFLIATLPDF